MDAFKEPSQWEIRPALGSTYIVGDDVVSYMDGR